MTQTIAEKNGGRRGSQALVVLVVALVVAMALVACGGGGGGGEGSSAGGTLFQVGTTTSDSNLPAEPLLPTDAQVCSTLQASNTLVSRPDGALPPEADP